MVKDFDLNDFILLNIFNPNYFFRCPKWFVPKLKIYYSVDSMADTAYFSKHGVTKEIKIIEKYDLILYNGIAFASENVDITSRIIKSLGGSDSKIEDKKGSKEATLNELKIEEHAKWDGIHGVITNHKNNDLSTEEILIRYRNLWQIEAAFRLNKHDLKI